MPSEEAPYADGTYRCNNCGLKVRTYRGDGITTCDCHRCEGCGSPDECICDDVWVDDMSDLAYEGGW